MTEQGAQALHSAQRLRQALEHMAAALAHADLESLLQGEEPIERALREHVSFSGLPSDERLLVRAELDAAKLALRRCRRLGGMLGDVARITFEAQGRGAGYGPTDVPAVGHLSTVNTRV